MWQPFPIFLYCLIIVLVITLIVSIRRYVKWEKANTIRAQAAAAKKAALNIVRKGTFSALRGNEFWLSTKDPDELIRVSVDDDEIRKIYYLKKVKITIELID